MKDVTDTDAREDARTGTGPDRWPTAPDDGRTGAHDGTAHEAAGLRDAGEPRTPGNGTGTDAGSLAGTAPGTDGTHATTRGTRETHGTDETHGTHSTGTHSTHGSHEPGTPGTGKHGTTGTGTHGTTGAGAAHTALLPDGERDRLELRVRDAVTHFVDRPRAAVEEADGAVEELLGRLTEALAERRRTLRRSWHDSDGTADTEQLRLALRDYRELAERLLHV
ncbi:hypothetical protein ABZ869_22990 [Streptomyces sp. NPDC046928]|uniref:hypothetical protein n=1 Tax=Streptomyces sp. NPDC046928 TaxID=3155021 RepID=UPI003410B7EF